MADSVVIQIFFLLTITFCVTAQNYQYIPSGTYIPANNIFNGCDYYETIELGRVYDVFSPYFPDKYPPGTNCRWSGCAPYGTNIVIKCTDMQIPTYGPCDEHGDRLEVSYQGCQELNDARRYCAVPFVMETRSNALVMALRTFPNSTGGKFFCQIYAKNSPSSVAHQMSPNQYIQGPSFPIRGNYVPAIGQPQQQYPPTYRPVYYQNGVRYEQGFQPMYNRDRFQDQGRPPYQSNYQPAYQNQIYRPTYRPAYQVVQPTYQTNYGQPQTNYAPVYNGYQSSYQSGYQAGYQQIYPIGQQKQIYPTYAPDQPGYQPVYHPMGPQDQGQCLCGLRKRPRILNGESVDIEQMPFACGLIDLDTKAVFCGCTIISENFILTGGHCLYNRSINTIGVIVGTTDTAHPQLSRYAATYRLFGAVIHQEYDPVSMLNDIAVAKTGPIQFNPAVAPVCLPISERLSEPNYAFSPVEVAGWGELRNTGPVSTVLQAATLNVITNEQCNDNFPYRITASQMCTLTPQKDACNGDDGAGLCHVDTVTGRLVIVGMPSYGVGCGTRQPRVATRVSSYIPWILRTTNEPYCVI